VKSSFAPMKKTEFDAGQRQNPVASDKMVFSIGLWTEDAAAVLRCAENGAICGDLRPDKKMDSLCADCTNEKHEKYE
jgi:hypothetical protein